MDEKKRVTMRDIAAACGVSLATVSGALNYSGRESIRDEVRLRIISTATRMHYRPAPRRESTLSAGIILHGAGACTPGKKVQQSDLAMELATALQQRGFLPAIIPDAPIGVAYEEEVLKKMDAWLMVDLDEDRFGKIEGFYGPALLLDAWVDTPLYCKILPDYPAIYEKANAILGDSATFLAMEDIGSRSLMRRVTVPFAPANIFVNRPGASLETFLERQRGRKGIVLGDLLAARAAEFTGTDDFVAVCRLKDVFPAPRHSLQVENARCATAAVDALCAMLDFDYPGSGSETNEILIAPK